MARPTEDEIRGFFYTYQGWMGLDLGLKGNEAIVYAIIYGFSQDGKSSYYGSYQHIADVIGLSRQTIVNTINSLVEKGMILKSEHSGSKCSYRAVWGSQKSLLVKNLDWVVQNFDHSATPLPPAPPITTSNNNINNIESNDSLSTSEIVDLWNSIVTNCSKVSKLSDARRQKVYSRIKEMGGKDKAREVLVTCFNKINNSEFCTGHNDRGWKVDFDWFFTNGTNWLKVYEGKYDNRDTVTPQTKDYPDGTYWKKDFSDEEIKKLFGFDLTLRKQLSRGYSIKRKNGQWMM